MSFPVTISVSGLGANTGPFTLLSNATGNFVVFQTNVDNSLILSPQTLTVMVPDDTTIVRVQSTGICNTHLDLFIVGGPQVTTTTTI